MSGIEGLMVTEAGSVITVFVAHEMDLIKHLGEHIVALLPASGIAREYSVWINDPDDPEQGDPGSLPNKVLGSLLKFGTKPIKGNIVLLGSFKGWADSWCALDSMLKSNVTAFCERLLNRKEKRASFDCASSLKHGSEIMRAINAKEMTSNGQLAVLWNTLLEKKRRTGSNPENAAAALDFKKFAQVCMCAVSGTLRRIETRVGMKLDMSAKAIVEVTTSTCEGCGYAVVEGGTCTTDKCYGFDAVKVIVAYEEGKLQLGLEPKTPEGEKYRTHPRSPNSPVGKKKVKVGIQERNARLRAQFDVMPRGEEL